MGRKRRQQQHNKNNTRWNVDFDTGRPWTRMMDSIVACFSYRFKHHHSNKKKTASSKSGMTKFHKKNILPENEI